MVEIENYNFMDLCMEKYCSNHITQTMEVDIYGIKLLFAFCDVCYFDFVGKKFGWEDSVLKKVNEVEVLN